MSRVLKIRLGSRQVRVLRKILADVELENYTSLEGSDNVVKVCRKVIRVIDSTSWHHSPDGKPLHPTADCGEACR